MLMFLCNISTTESNLLHREFMLSCAIINLLGFKLCVDVDKVLWSNENDSSFS